MPTDPAASAARHVIPDWLKLGFLTTLVFVTCWGSAITYWRTTGGNPATRDLLLWLFGLPACLLLVFFVGRQLINRSTAAPASNALPTPVKAAATPAQIPPLAILAASLRLPHGASAEELASAIADNKARADLDQELADDDGFPIMAARSSEAVDKALQEEVVEWLALNDMAELYFSDEQWRALTLASAVVAELAAQAMGPMLHQVGTQTRLQLVLLLPSEWDIAHRRATSMWLKQMVVRYGWPADHIIMDAEETGHLGAMSPAAVFKRLAHKVAPTDAPLIAMIVASASHIGHDTVAHWAENDALFTSSQPHGRIPGEGAAGLLISNQTALADSATIVLLDGIEEAHRDSSADETRRSDPKLLGELAERTIKGKGIDVADVAMLIADTGLRTNRVLELMAHVSAGLRQLDETDDVVRVGVACGTCGAVPFITALAIARHYVLEREAPVLCVSNEDPYRRIVALVRPSAVSS